MKDSVTQGEESPKGSCDDWTQIALHCHHCGVQFFRKVKGQRYCDEHRYLAGDQIHPKEAPTSNLVSQLREQAPLVDRGYADELMRAAADEIERLHADMDALYAVFSIGKDVRRQSILLVNIENACRRSECLSAIENELSKTVLDDETGEEMYDCPLSWGAEPSEYLKKFREILANYGPATAADDTVHVDFPKAWAPYLQAVILGALNDFDSDCRWHLNELQKRLGSFSAETGERS